MNIRFMFLIHPQINCFFLDLITGIVQPRSNDHVYIFLFVNIEIKTLSLQIQQSCVVLKTI